MFTSMISDSLPQRVATQIIAGIVVGTFAPGDVLPTEEQMCTQFGVSRSVIREAMRTVSGAGMTRSRQGRGTVILDALSWNEFSPDILRARVEAGVAGEFFGDFIELRTMIESQAAGLAAERAQQSHLDDARTQLRAMEDATDDPEAFIAADIEFHNVIVAATGNTMIIRLFDLLQPMLRTARERGHQPNEDGEFRDRRVDAAEHRLVFDFIEARDPLGARRAMSEHLRWVATRDIRRPRRMSDDALDDLIKRE